MVECATILRRPLVIAGYLALYVGLDWLSLIQPSGGASALGITPWNPPAGLTFAFLLRCGPAVAPAVFAAGALSSVLLHGPSAPGWRHFQPRLAAAPATKSPRQAFGFMAFLRVIVCADARKVGGQKGESAG